MSRRWVALLLLLAVPATADFKDDYEQGLAAAERGDWVQVAARMRSAIADRPESSGRLLALGLKRYLPHYYLGLALLETGDCRGAIAAFDEETRQEVVTKAKENETLLDRRAACASLITEVEGLVARLSGPLDEAANRLSEAARLSRAPELQREWPTTFGEDQRLAGNELRRARSDAARAEQELDRAALQELSVRLSTLRSDLDRLLAAAGERQAQVRNRAEGQLREIDKLVGAARSDLRFVSYLEPFPPALDEARQRLEERLSEAASAGVGNSEEELEDLRRRILADLSRLRREVKSPPDSLREVAVAYFGAEYDRAIQLLDASTLTDARAVAQACLLRSATLHAVARRAGGTARLLERVRQQVRSCLDAQPVVEPPPAFFPPSFLAVFEGEKTALAAERAATSAAETAASQDEDDAGSAPGSG